MSMSKTYYVWSRGVKRMIPDHYSMRGAQALADRLQALWRRRGYSAAQFWIESAGPEFDVRAEQKHAGTYIVRSNLINGWPPVPMHNAAAAAALAA